MKIERFPAYLLVPIIIVITLLPLTTPALASDLAEEVADPFTAAMTITIENEFVDVPAELAGTSFSYALTPLDGAPSQSSDRVTICGEGSAELTLRFDLPGTYLYGCRQLDGDKGDDAWIIDDTEYTIVVAVFTDDSGRLYASAAIRSGAGDKSETCAFRNGYYIPAPPETEPTPPDDEPKSPETGDTSRHITPLILLALIAAAAFTAQRIHTRRTKENE